MSLLLNSNSVMQMLLWGNFSNTLARTVRDSQESFLIQFISHCLAACQGDASRLLSLEYIPSKACPLMHFQLQSYISLIKKYPLLSSASVSGCWSINHCFLQTKMSIVCKLHRNYCKCLTEKSEVFELERAGEKKGISIGIYIVTKQLVV